MNKGIWGIFVAVAFVAGTISVNPVAEAANPLLEDIAATLGLIQTETDKIQSIKDDIAALETGVSAETEAQIDDIETETDKIQMIKDNQYEPFYKKFSSGSVTCAAAGAGSDSDTLIIDSQANSGTFTVNSIIVRPVPQSIDEASDTIVVHLTRVDSDVIGIVSNDFTGSNTFVNIFDVLGAQLANYDGFFPRHITAESAGTDDIQLTFSCNAGTTTDLKLNTFHISGWKQVGDTINVSYSET